MMTSKIKKAIIAAFTLCLIYLIVEYIKFNKEKEALENLYENSWIISDIESYFSLVFEIRGKLPNEEETLSFLRELDSIIFVEDNFHLKIDSKLNKVLLYLYGANEKDDCLKNKIDSRGFIDNDRRVISNLNFIDYLFKSEYDVLLYSDKLKYNCSEALDNKSIFVDNEGDIILSDLKLTNQLDDLLSSLGMSLSIQKDLSNSTVFIYNGIKLNNMCDGNHLSLTEIEKKDLLSLLEAKFSGYKYIKFTVQKI